MRMRTRGVCQNIYEGGDSGLKAFNLRGDLDTLETWAWDPKTKISQVSFKRWLAKNKLRLAGQKGGK